MQFNKEFGERYKINVGIGAVDLSAAANGGTPFNINKMGSHFVDVFPERITGLVYKGAGTAGDDITITVTQPETYDADSVTADPLICSSIHSRPGSSVDERWTLEAENVSSWTSDDNAEKAMLLAIDIPIYNINPANGAVAVNISQAGSAGNRQEGGCLMLGHLYHDNAKFVEMHNVVLGGPADISSADFKRRINWDANPEDMRRLTFIGVTGRGTAGEDAAFEVEATDSTNTVDMPFNSVFTTHGTGHNGIDYDLRHVRFPGGTASYTDDQSAENASICVVDFTYYDIPDSIRSSAANSLVDAGFAQTTNSQIAAVLGITSGTRYALES